MLILIGGAGRVIMLLQAEFVRLSHEIEKGNAFEGHKGEDDEVFRYQVLTPYQETMAASA
jgi:hypothetical protein